MSDDTSYPRGQKASCLPRVPQAVGPEHGAAQGLPPIYCIFVCPGVQDVLVPLQPCSAVLVKNFLLTFIADRLEIFRRVCTLKIKPFL